MKKIGIIHAYPNSKLILSLMEYDIYLFVPKSIDLSHIEEGDYLHIFRVDLEHTVDNISQICHLALENKISAFLPLYEGGLVLSAIVSERLNLPFYPLSTVLASRNKYNLQLLLNTAFVETPKSIPVFLYTPYKFVREKLGEKIVLKMVDSMNSQAVMTVNDEESYQRALKDIFEYLEKDEVVTDRNRFCYGQDEIKVIAQEFCQGKEVNIDFLIRNQNVISLGIFEKAITKGPYFPETKSFFPSTLTKQEEEQIVNMGTAALKAMQIDNGAAHVELRFQANTPKILDIGLRPGGAYTIAAVENLTGMNMVTEIAKTMLKDSGFISTVDIDRNKAILYGGIVFHKEGIVRKAEGIDQIQNNPLFKDLVILAHEGDEVVPPPFSAQPHYCYYYLQGSSLKELLSLDTDIRKNVSLEII